MPRVEFPVPCPHCGRKITLSLEELRPGAAVACPDCGRAVTFRGTGAERVQQALDLLGDRVKKVKVKLNVRRKS